MDIYQIVNQIKLLIEPILKESGKVVYSSVDTIKLGEIYVLGLNPGGEIFVPINDDLDQLAYKHTNAYLDEAWSNRQNPKFEKGRHPLQKNVTGLLQNIGYSPREVFSSNLIFTRSRKAEVSMYRSKADICWAVHKEFIKIIDPKCFIVFGNAKISPFQYIKDRYSLKISDKINSGHGDWQCLSCSGIIEGKERVLIGLPHLSRYYVNRHESVIKWIISKL